ncbi:MAG TPA: prolipoprotein diacylglyceryl transferase family protein [Steroidobacteraceae bacterium]
MIPFIHLGRVTLSTYGFMLATAAFMAYYVTRAELERRHLDPSRTPWIMLLLTISSLVFAKLYYLVFEQPSIWTLHQARLIDGTGFTAYGALFGSFLGGLLIARLYRMPVLQLFDVLSVGWVLGYGICRIGCFLSGDGCYGIPTSLPWGMSFPDGLVPTTQRVHPTPLYEFITSAAIALYLWRLGSPSRRVPVATGTVFAQALIWSSLARFLVEFIKLNPPVWLGLVNAQWVAMILTACGLVLWWRLHERGQAALAAVTLGKRAGVGRRH